MKVFLSWSGERSRSMARALQDWLPDVIQAVEPWMSESSIDKGSRGIEVIGQALEEHMVGILCLTKDNISAPWILFEAGAIAKHRERCWTLLLDLKHTDVEPPLGQFQHTDAMDAEDVLKLLLSINTQVEAHKEKSLAPERLRALFRRFWPDLKDKLDSIPKADSKKPLRDERALLEEILEHVRAQRLMLPPTMFSEGPSQSESAVARAMRAQSKLRADPTVRIAVEEPAVEVVDRINNNPVVHKLATMRVIEDSDGGPTVVELTPVDWRSGDTFHPGGILRRLDLHPLPKPSA